MTKCSLSPERATARSVAQGTGSPTTHPVELSIGREAHHHPSHHAVQMPPCASKASPLTRPEPLGTVASRRTTSCPGCSSRMVPEAGTYRAVFITQQRDHGRLDRSHFAILTIRIQMHRGSERIGPPELAAVGRPERMRDMKGPKARQRGHCRFGAWCRSVPAGCNCAPTRRAASATSGPSSSRRSRVRR